MFNKKMLYIAAFLFMCSMIFLISRRVSSHNHVINARADLTMAMARGDHAGVSRLVGSGVPLNYDIKGELPVVNCVRNKDFKSLRLLLENGLKVDGLAGADALVLAVKNKDRVSIDLLLQYGADPHDQNHFGRTAAQEAAEMKNAELSSLLNRK